MDFNPNARLDNDVQSAGGGAGGGGGFGGGGRGGGIAVGGIGGVILLILAAIFGFGNIFGGGNSTTPQSGSQPTTNSNSNCRTGADVQNNRECRWDAYVTSINNYWSNTLNGYTKAKTITFTGSINTGCGRATSQVGPFYCPEDKRVYIDTGFADELLQKLGAQGGYAAEAYILAHEYGHHVSDLTGQLAKAQSSNETGPTSPGVRLELQADCYAGVWFKNASQNPNDVIQNITQDDLNRVVDAAAAVGDDRIQSSTQGQVNPESWTHGSAKMRKYWVAQGFNSGNPRTCDTFSTNNLGQ